MNEDRRNRMSDETANRALEVVMPMLEFVSLDGTLVMISPLTIRSAQVLLANEHCPLRTGIQGRFSHEFYIVRGDQTALVRKMVNLAWERQESVIKAALVLSTRPR